MKISFAQAVDRFAGIPQWFSREGHIIVMRSDSFLNLAVSAIRHLKILHRAGVDANADWEIWTRFPSLSRAMRSVVDNDLACSPCVLSVNNEQFSHRDNPHTKMILPDEACAKTTKVLR